MANQTILTKEERKAQRRAEREAKIKQFPGAFIGCPQNTLQLVIDDGYKGLCVQVRSGDIANDLPPDVGNDPWKCGYIWLDVEQAIELAEALCCRIRQRLEDLNKQVDNINLTPLKQIKDVQPAP